jgi:hypothetical protein
MLSRPDTEDGASNVDSSTSVGGQKSQVNPFSFFFSLFLSFFTYLPIHQPIYLEYHISFVFCGSLSLSLSLCFRCFARSRPLSSSTRFSPPVTTPVTTACKYLSMDRTGPSLATSICLHTPSCPPPLPLVMPSHISKFYANIWKLFWTFCKYLVFRHVYL